MKKALCILLSLLILFSLAACKGNTDTDRKETESTSDPTVSQSVESTSNSVPQSDTTESTTESTTAPTTQSTTVPTTQATTNPTTTQKPTEKPTAPSTSKAQTKADLGTIKKTIISTLKISDSMDISQARLNDLYGIDSKDIASSACFITVSGSFPEEAIMLEASSSQAKGRIVNLLNSRLADVKVQSESYDEENYALAQSCKVISKGNYVALFISASHSEMEKIFLATVK